MLQQGSAANLNRVRTVVALCTLAAVLPACDRESGPRRSTGHAPGEQAGAEALSVPARPPSAPAAEARRASVRAGREPDASAAEPAAAEVDGSAAAPQSEQRAEPAPSGPDPMALDGAHSTSLGGPSSGRLEGGVPLPMRGPGFRFNPRRRPEARYGTVEVVQALMRAAATVDREMPGGELTVNDLSLEPGGPIDQHGSHRSGRDVDVLFYLLDADGAPIDSVGAPLDPKGEGWDFKDLADRSDDVRVRIDLGRTWRFVQALLEDPEAHLQRIYVAEHLRTMLLAHAREVNAPPRMVRRFELATCQPGYPHDDHFHFRFFCTPQDIRAGCEDSLPIYPWHRRHLREAGVEVAVAKRKRNRKRSKITTAEEAREQAGEMHERVRAFLDRREAWMDKPHPGRPYCP